MQIAHLALGAAGAMLYSVLKPMAADFRKGFTSEWRQEKRGGYSQAYADMRIAAMIRRQDRCPHRNTHTERSLGAFCDDCGKPV